MLIFFLFISGNFVWETNLQPVNGIIPWAANSGNGAAGEQVIILVPNDYTTIQAVSKDFSNGQGLAVLCEF